MLRVLALDDNGPYRQVMTQLLESQPDMEVVGQAATLAEVEDLFPCIS